MDSHSDIRPVASAITTDPIALWLCQLPGVTLDLLRRLHETYGSAEAIVRAPSSALRALGVAPGLVARLVASARDVPRVAAGLKGYERLGIVPLPLLAPTYPDRLRDLDTAPLVVYVQGAWPLPAPLALVGTPAAPSEAIVEPWSNFVQMLDRQICWATLDPTLLSAPPRLLAVPYGLMLARQRLPAALLKAVANGETTLLSIAAPNAQPSDPSPALSTTLLALADALVLLAPPPDAALVTAARNLGVPAFMIDPKAPALPGVRRLRPGKAGVRSFRAALGIHMAGSATAHQERLF